MEIGDILKRSWSITREHWAQLFLMGLPAGIAMAFGFSFINSNSSSVGLVGIAIFLFAIYLGTSLVMGYANSIETKDYSFSQAFVAFSNKYNWPLLAFISLVATVGMWLGFSFFVIPGLVLTLGWSTIFYQYQDNLKRGRKTTFVGAFKEAWDLMDGHKMQLFLLGIVFFVILLVSLMILVALTGVSAYFNGIFGTILGILLSVLYILEMIVLSVWGSVAKFVFYQDLKKQK